MTSSETRWSKQPWRANEETPLSFCAKIVHYSYKQSAPPLARSNLLYLPFPPKQLLLAFPVCTPKLSFLVLFIQFPIHATTGSKASYPSALSTRWTTNSPSSTITAQLKASTKTQHSTLQLNNCQHHGPKTNLPTHPARQRPSRQSVLPCRASPCPSRSPITSCLAPPP